jgi:hypothetical protein
MSSCSSRTQQQHTTYDGEEEGVVGRVVIDSKGDVEATGAQEAPDVDKTEVADLALTLIGGLHCRRVKDLRVRMAVMHVQQRSSSRKRACCRKRSVKQSMSRDGKHEGDRKRTCLPQSENFSLSRV